MAICFLGAERVDGDYPAIPADSPFWQIVEFVDHEVDLEQFVARYEPLGRSAPPYDPRLMVAAWLWCTAHGVRSPSAVARWCRQDAVLAAWFGDRVPSRSTLRQFMITHRRAWQTLLPASVAVCARLGLADAAITATDGTVFSAPGSLRQARSLWWLHWQIREVSEQLRAEQARCVARSAPASPEALAEVLDDVAGAGLRRQHHLHQQLTRLQAAATACERPPSPPTTTTETTETRPTRLRQQAARQQATLHQMINTQRRHYEQWQQRRAREPVPGKPSLPPHQCRHIQTQHQRLKRTRAKLRDLDTDTPHTDTRSNPADPTARICKGKNDTRWVYGDTVICTVDRHQTILALTSYGTATDQGTLHPNLTTARHSLTQAGINQPIRLNLADAGCASRAAFTTPTEGLCLIDVRPRTTPSGTPYTDPTYQRMIARLDNPAGQRLYHRRMSTIEPVFAHLTCHGGRQLHYRSPTRNTELTVMATSHNLAKITRCQRANPTNPYPPKQPLKTITIRNSPSHPPGY